MDQPLPRESVRGIPAYVAGRPPAARPGLTPHKLSSNENPYPPLPGVVEAVTAAAATMNRYPDMGNTALYEALAEKLDVPESQLAVGTGSVALVYHLVQAWCGPGDEVVHAWRSFEAYPIAIAAAGATAVPVPLTATGDHDLDAMLGAVTGRTRVVLLCTPNNPTGPSLTHSQVMGFVRQVPSDVLVVADEAYLEFVRREDPPDGVMVLRANPNLVLLRTFSKAYGLAGLRVGYAVADTSVAQALRAVSLPFGVSAVAQAAAVASLQREDELLERVDAIVAERARVLAGLRDQGWQVPDSQANFVWLPLGDRAVAFAEAAGREGLSVRPFAGDGVRVSVGVPEANDRFLDVAGRFLG